MKPKIIPTIFALKEEDFQKRFEKLVAVSRELQIDFMDGRFVKGRFLDFSSVPNLKGKGTFEAHLMTLHPEKYISILKKKGFKKIIFHYNAGDNVKIIAQLKKSKILAFLAINPEIKIEDVCYLFDFLDGVLIMGVHPGREHQKLINSTYKKIEQIRNINKKIVIQIDGGISPDNIKNLARAGADIFNTGSFVSESANPGKALLKLKKELKR